MRVRFLESVRAVRENKRNSETPRLRRAPVLRPLYTSSCVERVESGAVFVQRETARAARERRVQGQHAGEHVGVERERPF